MKGDADPAGVVELRELRSCTEGRRGKRGGVPEERQNTAPEPQLVIW